MQHHTEQQNSWKPKEDTHIHVHNTISGGKHSCTPNTDNCKMICGQWESCKPTKPAAKLYSHIHGMLPKFS